MNWKLLSAIMLAVIVGYVAYTAVALYFSGQPFTIGSFIETVTTQATGLTVFVMEKFTLVAGAIGSAVTLVGLGYKVVSNKISSVENKTKTQLAEMQEQTMKQMKAMDETIKTQEQTITTLNAKVEAQTDLQQDYDALTTRFSQVNEQCKTQQSTINTYERMGNIEYVKKLQETLKINKIPIPEYDGPVLKLLP